MINKLVGIVSKKEFNNNWLESIIIKSDNNVRKKGILVMADFGLGSNGSLCEVCIGKPVEVFLILYLLQLPRRITHHSDRRRSQLKVLQSSR